MEKTPQKEDGRAPTLTVIIVNWNTKDLTTTCVRSVYDTIKKLPFKVIIVDNGSTDGSVQHLKNVFPQVRIIENDRNLGFARANNIAMAEAKSDYVVFLNSDARLTESAIERIVEVMEADDKIAIAGARLLNEDGSLQNSMSNFPSLLSEAFNKSLLRRLNPQKYIGKGQFVTQPIEVEAVIGACMVARKAAIDEVGNLDEDYFFFWEETDWCYRFHQAGWKVFFVPDACVYHLQGKSATKDLANARIEFYRSRYLFFEKHYGFVRYLASRVFHTVRLAIESLAYVAGNVLTLFLSRKLRTKLAVRTKLLLWHLLGCPARWGLKRNS